MRTDTDLMCQIMAVTAGLNRRFPDGDEPYQIMTRLLEECGELAQQVNHFDVLHFTFEV
jgi:NTP pyrophosphatase (non-canonical NTP hydrolase)